MGKRLITQRRGRGTSAYKSYSNRFEGKIGFNNYKKDAVLKGVVEELVHCRGHTAPLMRIVYEDNRECLLPAYNGCFEGAEFELNMKSEKVEVKKGNSYLLKNIPEGLTVYNVEMKQGDGGILSRTSGSSVRVVSHLGKYTKVVLPSKKEKLLKNNCRVILGEVGGKGRTEKPFAKAGVKYFKMKKTNKLYPRVSGGKMSANEHPFGNTRSLFKGGPTIAPKNAPPGRKAGMIRPRSTGCKK